MPPISDLNSSQRGEGLNDIEITDMDHADAVYIKQPVESSLMGGEFLKLKKQRTIMPKKKKGPQGTDIKNRSNKY